MHWRKGGASMANIFDVAQYILEREGPMTTMKLQKLCYYSQAWSLVWDNALFEEEFQAWANGPVCKELFDMHKGQYLISAEDILENKRSGETLTDEQKENIELVLEYYGDKNAQWLSTLTHMEEPWRQARHGVPEGEFCDTIISKESMMMYYGSL